MAVLQDIINNYGNCDTAQRGTGLGDCIKIEGDVTGLAIVAKSWRQALTVDYTETLYKADIQSQIVNPLPNLYSFTQDTPDTERATGNTGLLRDIRKGKPQYTFTYSEGYGNHRNIYAFDNIPNNIIFLFETGLFVALDTDGTNIKGFDANLISVDTYKFQQGSDPDMSMLMVQFSNPQELNTRGRFFTWDELGFNANFIEGVINTELTYNTTPTATTTVQVAVKDDLNQSVNIAGLTATDNWALGGTQASTTTISNVAYDASGFYTLTLSPTLASGDTIRPRLVDGTDNVAEDAAGNLYRGQAPLATIA